MQKSWLLVKFTLNLKTKLETQASNQPTITWLAVTYGELIESNSYCI